MAIYPSGMKSGFIWDKFCKEKVYHICATCSTTVFHYNPELRPLDIGSKVSPLASNAVILPRDVFTVHLCEYGYFFHDIVDIILGIIKIHNFDCNRLMRGLVIPTVNSAPREPVTLCKHCQNSLDLSGKHGRIWKYRSFPVLRRPPPD